jgi:hypothetical protein
VRDRLVEAQPDNGGGRTHVVDGNAQTRKAMALVEVAHDCLPDVPSRAPRSPPRPYSGLLLRLDQYFQIA